MTSPKKRRVLIIDDMPHWRKLLSNLLIEHEVRAFATYGEAKDALEQ